MFPCHYFVSYRRIAFLFGEKRAVNRVFISLIILFAGLGAILIVQAMQTSTSRVFTPSELANHSEAVKRIRIVGKVAPHKLEYQTEPHIQLSFHIQDPEGEREETVPVQYNKLMPDMFAPGRSVIIDGEFDGVVVRAESLMTQCPSKYEPPAPTSSQKKPTSLDIRAESILTQERATQSESIAQFQGGT